jgi:hypothetical protein
LKKVSFDTRRVLHLLSRAKSQPAGNAPGRATQLVLNRGGDRLPRLRATWFGAQVRCAPIIMNDNLIYRGPEPSRATRIPARRSKGSLRGFIIAKLPGFDRPRTIYYESALEYAFLCLMLVRDDVYHIQEQPPAISYVAADGRPARHVFDFLVTTKDGERIAVAIKPARRVLKLGFAAELEAVAAAVSKSFADRVLLVTDQHIDRVAAAEAARKLAWSRSSLTEVAA